MRNPIGKKVVDIKPSGIRKFFDIVLETEGAISLGVGAQIGLEYDFLTDLDVPLQLSLDLRPMAHFYLLGHYKPANDLYQYFGWGVALGVRYIFH